MRKMILQQALNGQYNYGNWHCNDNVSRSELDELLTRVGRYKETAFATLFSYFYVIFIASWHRYVQLMNIAEV